MIRVARQFLFLCALNLAFGQVYVTYSFSGGRFGDNLAAYVHAKWFAHKYGYKLVFRPFLLCDRLKLSREELNVRLLNLPLKEGEGPYSHILKRAIAVPKDQRITKELLRNLENKNGDTFFHLEYFPPALPDLYNKHYDNNFHTNIEIDWNDSVFVNEIREAIRPIKSQRKVSLPKECINIAVHFRRGSRIDDPKADQLDPLKFPPLEYFRNQLKQCLHFFPEKKLSVLIFTDYDDPKAVVGYLQSGLVTSRINYDFHKGRGYRGRTLMDFFSMMEFDCIIRSASSYSTMAAKISPCWLEIGPKNFAFVDGKPRITEVELRYRPEKIGDAIKNLQKMPYEKHFVEVKAQ